MVHLPPTRADIANTERLARNLLRKSKDPDTRILCKQFLAIADSLDAFVESVYPCFGLLEQEIRHCGCVLSLEKDGVFRLRDPETSIVCSGASLKDFCINMVLWHGDWQETEFMAELASEEDLAMEQVDRDSRQNLS